MRHRWKEEFQEIKLDLLIAIPSDKVLVDKVALYNLESEQLIGKFWSMAELEKRLNRNQRWIKERILMNPEFRRQLDVDFGGFVYYPQHNGEKWAFQATKMAYFLEDNFYTIFKERNDGTK